MHKDYMPKALCSATYLTSASKPDSLPHPVTKEIMFIGRSKAGKSSVINALLNQKIARTSRTPGRTQQINFFQLNSKDCFVDCPGYGFAAVKKSMQDTWPALIDACLKRPNLVGIVWIMDIRHPLQKADLLIQEQLVPTPCPMHIVLNKADKLNNQNKARCHKQVLDAIATWNNNFSISCGVFSVLKKTGLNKLQEQICSWLDVEY